MHALKMARYVTADCRVRVVVLMPPLMLIVASPSLGQNRLRWDAWREQMVNEVIIGSGIKDRRVIDAMRATPRHEFVPTNQRRRAYFDMALPIGNGQTISSPFIVAFMTESVVPQPSDRVLEIGTGSGYQAAVLSSLVQDVYSIEIVPALSARASRTLKRLRIDNVHLRVGDGYAGWPEHAPFDKIIVTCSPENVPQTLVDQLRDGGTMVIPVGERYQQTLFLFRKTDGQLQSQALRPTLFVPMTGQAESERSTRPDAIKPSVVNGDFEQQAVSSGQIPGWYYQRQVNVRSDESAPDGNRYAVFANQDPGRFSHAMQGMGADGRQISRLRISAWVRLKAVSPDPSGNTLPAVVVTFYDVNRRELKQVGLGPWRGTLDWVQIVRTHAVPRDAREAILRVGLFGATGEFAVDAVELQSYPR